MQREMISDNSVSLKLVDIDFSKECLSHNVLVLSTIERIKVLKSGKITPLGLEFFIQIKIAPC